MFQLIVHEDAKADLKQLAGHDSVSAARIVALLEEIEGDQDLLDCLTQHDFGHDRTAGFHVSKWNQLWRAGADLWRLKAWDLEDKGIRYRVVYAYIPGKQRYYILGILPRSWNYEKTHPLTKRILSAYELL